MPWSIDGSRSPVHTSGHNSKWWATYNQWRSLGGQVRRGEKATQIILYKHLLVDTITHTVRPSIRPWPVMTPSPKAFWSPRPAD